LLFWQTARYSRYTDNGIRQAYISWNFALCYSGKFIQQNEDIPNYLLGKILINNKFKNYVIIFKSIVYTANKQKLFFVLLSVSRFLRRLINGVVHTAVEE
jgi:hypothetical protein